MSEHTKKSAKETNESHRETEEQKNTETAQQNTAQAFEDGVTFQPPPNSTGLSPQNILRLQSTIGNRATIQLLQNKQITPTHRTSSLPSVIQRDADVLDTFFNAQNQVHGSNKLSTSIEVPFKGTKASLSLTIESKVGTQDTDVKTDVDELKPEVKLPTGEGETKTTHKKDTEGNKETKSSYKYKIKSGITASLISGVYREDNLVLSSSLYLDGPSYERATDEDGKSKDSISVVSVNAKVIGTMLVPEAKASYNIVVHGKIDVPLETVKELIEKGMAKRLSKEAGTVAKEMQRQAKEAAEVAKKRLTDQVKMLDDELVKLKPGTRPYTDKLAERTLAEFDVKDIDEFIQKVDSKEMLEAFEHHAREELTDVKNAKKATTVYKFLAKPMSKVMGSRLMKSVGKQLLKFVPGLNIVMTVIDIVEIGSAIYNLIKHGPGTGGGGGGDGEKSDNAQDGQSGGENDGEGQGGKNKNADNRQEPKPGDKSKQGDGGGTAPPVELNRSVKFILDALKAKGDTANGDKPFTPEQLKRLNQLIPENLMDDSEKVKKLLEKLQGDGQPKEGGTKDPETIIVIITQWLQNLDANQTSNFELIDIDFERATSLNPIEQQVLKWKTSDFTGRDDMPSNGEPFAAFIAAFQSRIGLEVDGIAGPRTTEAFFREQKQTDTKFYKKATQEIKRRSERKSKKNSKVNPFYWKDFKFYFKQDEKTEQFSPNTEIIEKMKGKKVDILQDGGIGAVQDVQITPVEDGQWEVMIIYKVEKAPQGHESIEGKVLAIEWYVWYREDFKKLYGTLFMDPEIEIIQTETSGE